MKPNPLKQKLARDEVAVGLMLLSSDPHVVGITAGAGFDCVMADLEHASISLRELEAVVRAADAAGIVPTTRVAGPTKPDILAVLETGVRGIMAPAVESAAEAEMIVQAARYGPFGRRGVYYLGYNSQYAGISPADHFRTSNEELLVIVQIETAQGVRNAGEIAAVPGVDCLFVGPGDLSMSLGAPCEFDHPALWDAIRSAFRAARLHGKVAGIMPAGVDHAERSVEEGARLLLWGPDLALFQRAAREDAALLAERVKWKRSRPPGG
jgi:2-keto-3-deoxy-L-rhamnonate aldolase RhmA